jgi:hypothetical protein
MVANAVVITSASSAIMKEASEVVPSTQRLAFRSVGSCIAAFSVPDAVLRRFRGHDEPEQAKDAHENIFRQAESFCLRQTSWGDDGLCKL